MCGTRTCVIFKLPVTNWRSKERDMQSILCHVNRILGITVNNGMTTAGMFFSPYIPYNAHSPLVLHALVSECIYGDYCRYRIRDIFINVSVVVLRQFYSRYSLQASAFPRMRSHRRCEYYIEVSGLLIPYTFLILLNFFGVNDVHTCDSFRCVYMLRSRIK